MTVTSRHILTAVWQPTDTVGAPTTAGDLRWSVYSAEASVALPVRSGPPRAA